MINLNEIKVGGSSSIFNNGDAGEVLATISVVKKPAGDISKAPDWKILFTDKSGNTLNEGFYYIDPSRYESEEKYNNFLRREATRLKHLVNALYGEIEFPAYATTKDMLDSCMNMIARKTGMEVKIGATYGTVNRPSNYLQLKSTFPFILGDLEKSINFNKNDLMERPAPSAPKEEADSKLPWGD